MNLVSCEKCGLVYDLNNTPLDGKFDAEVGEYKNVCWDDYSPCKTSICICGFQNDTTIKLGY